MNNIVDNFSQILEFGKNYGLPFEKKKAILREYLQSRAIEIIYQQKKSADMVFVGGTALRLLRGLDRFSEDLDFDLTGKLDFEKADLIVKSISTRFLKENIAVSLYLNKKPKRIYYELRFPDLLYDLKLSKNKQEKLMIKIDIEKFWLGHHKETILFNRYGALANVVTSSLDNVLVQKMVAYKDRGQTMARDIYDIIWLVGYGACIDKDFIKKNKITPSLKNQILNKYEREKKSIKIFKNRLKPFLIYEDNVKKLDYFQSVVNQLI
jgi:predicted nucleotidyltransferase component of viral defense system